MRINLVTLLDEPVGGSFFSDSINILHALVYNFQITGDGDITGVFVLQESLDNINWTDVTGSTLVMTDDTANMINVRDSGAAYVRVKFTYDSGVGVIKIVAASKAPH